MYMYQSNQSFYIPPSPQPGNPRAFEFLENFCSNSPLTGPKSCSNAPPPGKVPDYCFNFSVASVVAYCFWNCACKDCLLDNTYLYIIKYKSFWNTFKYETQLV